MGFLEIRAVVIECLRVGAVQHEARNDIDTKNLLVTGEISTEEVIRLLKGTKGFQYETSPHHTLRNLTVYIFKPEMTESTTKVRWYIKCYLLEPDVWFISVHKSERGQK